MIVQIGDHFDPLTSIQFSSGLGNRALKHSITSQLTGLREITGNNSCNRQKHKASWNSCRLAGLLLLFISRAIQWMISNPRFYCLEVHVRYLISWWVSCTV